MLIVVNIIVNGSPSIYIQNSNVELHGEKYLVTRGGSKMSSLGHSNSGIYSEFLVEVNKVTLIQFNSKKSCTVS